MGLCSHPLTLAILPFPCRSAPECRYDADQSLLEPRLQPGGRRPSANVWCICRGNITDSPWQRSRLVASMSFPVQPSQLLPAGPGPRRPPCSSRLPRSRMGPADGLKFFGLRKAKPVIGTPTPRYQYVPHGNFFKFSIGEWLEIGESLESINNYGQL